MVEGHDASDKNKTNKSLKDLPDFQFSGTGQAPIEDQDSHSGDEDEDLGVDVTTGDLKAPPIQKRRRVTRACDECRRKKIKCDGKQPCTHCTVYSYDCTYDQPSNRRRNPTPQYVEALENRVQRAEALLKTILPNIDLSDPNFPNNIPASITLSNQPPEADKYGHVQGKGSKSQTEAERDSLLESMVKDTGSLDLDDEGHWDFHGHSSGMVFLQRLRQQYGDMFGNVESLSGMLAKPRYTGPASRTIESPQSGDSPFDFTSTAAVDLPPREVAAQLCDLSMGDACSLMRFMHVPTFWIMFDKLYDTPPESWSTEEHRYLPLLYALLAVGTMFAKGEDSQLQKEGYVSGLDIGFKWFRAARQSLDITDCRDIPSLQAVVCMIMFLQSTARLSTCWCYVGIALHSAIRMGLHRSIPGRFNFVEEELRRRLFWQIRKMDVYVGAMIGLPTMLSEDDYDQDYPLDIDDQFITPMKILPSPPDYIHLIAGSNAQTKLVVVLRKVIKYVYPIRGIQYLEGKPRSYVVSHAKIREIERDLQHWMEELPMFLRPGGEASPDLARVQQLLRMAYAYVQMFLYRPFLHYVSQSTQQTHVDKRSYACAAACVSVSRNVIHITQEMSRRGLLIGSFWFTMYTTFLAIMALIFFALENPDSKASEDIMQDARTGKEILAKLAKGSMAADRCTQTLSVFFDKLPERLRHSRSMNMSSAKRKSIAISPVPPIDRAGIANPNLKLDAREPTVQRASTFPRHEQHTFGQQYTNHAQTDYPDQPYLQDQRYAQSTSETDAFSSPEPASRETEAINFDQYSFSNANGGLAVAGYGVPDLSAMMFPSTDPFAYPNQPMMTLEKNAGFASTSPQGSNTPGTNSNMSPPKSNLYNMQRGSLSNGSGLEAQLLDPLQPYLTMGYGQGSNAGVFSAEMGLGIEGENLGMPPNMVKEEYVGNEQPWWGQISSGESAGGMPGNASGPWAI